MNLIETKQLTKLFPLGKDKYLHAVEQVDLTIVLGETLGLVGESGSGKSTLGRLLIGLLDQTSGSRQYADQVLPEKYRQGDFKQYAKQIQMIFQDPYASLNPRMTVGEIVSEGLIQVRGASKQEALKKSAEWLVKVGLTQEQMNRYPHEFSGGQRQRVGIARALAVEPKFIVCDEPISALDVSVQAQIVNLLQSVKEEFGLTLLFIAHDLSMVRYISDRIAVMYLGQIVELGEADQIFFDPQHPYTQALINSNPEADPKKERGKQKPSIQGEIPSAVNPTPGCRFVERCPMAESSCRTENPEWKQINDGRYVRCHLLNNI